MELGEEAVLDELGGAGVNACFGLEGCQMVRVEEEEGKRTWPPEKPTATTPSSLPRVRNLGWTMLVVVIVAIAGRSDTKKVYRRRDDCFLSVIFCFWVLSIRGSRYYWLKAVVGQVKMGGVGGGKYDDDSDLE